MRFNKLIPPAMAAKVYAVAKAEKITNGENPQQFEDEGIAIFCNEGYYTKYKDEVFLSIDEFSEKVIKPMLNK